jgi:hypothetical protein
MCHPGSRWLGRPRLRRCRGGSVELQGLYRFLVEMQKSDWAEDGVGSGGVRMKLKGHSATRTEINKGGKLGCKIRVT